MKLPVEVSLHILGYLDRQTLGRVLVANRRLSGIVIRHKKALNLHKIRIPPKLSAFLKGLAFLAAITLVLVPTGVWYAKRSTRSRLRAAGRLPEKFHGAEQVRHSAIPILCTTTCDSQMHCRENCSFQHTLPDEHVARITKRNCSGTDVPPTNASSETRVKWNCSLEYAVNASRIDSDRRKRDAEAKQGMTVISVSLAVLALMDVVLLLRTDSAIADAYAAATRRRRRNRIRRKREHLRKCVIGAAIGVFIYAGLFGSAALRGMTSQSFRDIDDLFGPLFMTSLFISYVILVSCAFVYDPHWYGVSTD